LIFLHPADANEKKSHKNTKPIAYVAGLYYFSARSLIVPKPLYELPMLETLGYQVNQT